MNVNYDKYWGGVNPSFYRWRRSNWAFLNEPPETEGSGNSYVSQFHVANMAASRLGRGGISA